MNSRWLFLHQQRPPLSKAAREQIARLAFEIGGPLMMVIVIKDVFF
jgi:hypothetical protein